MKLINHISFTGFNKSRFEGFSIDFENQDSKCLDTMLHQEDSHGISYLFCRKQYQEMGELMGLDVETQDILDEINIYCDVITDVRHKQLPTQSMRGIYRMLRNDIIERHPKIRNTQGGFSHFYAMSRGRYIHN